MQDINHIRPDSDNQSKAYAFVNSLPPLAYIIIVLGIIFFLYQIIGGSIAFFALTSDFEENISVSRILLSLSQFIFILIPAIIFSRLQNRDLKNTFRLNVPNPFIFFLAILGITFINPVIHGYMVLQELIIRNLPFYEELIKPLQKLFEEMDLLTIKLVSSYSLTEFLVVAFVIAVTPAICEEILFRGFVLKNFERFTRSFTAIFLTGFFFALYHFQPFNVIPLILLGVYIGFVVYYTNSIFTGMAVHFLNNFYAAYIVFKFGKDVNVSEFGGNTFEMVIIILVSLFLFIGICFIIYKFGKRLINVQHSG